MKKVQETVNNCEVNSPDGSPDDNSENKYYSQGARPKVKNYAFYKENKVLVHNGSSSQSDKVSNFQNGASCSLMSSSLSGNLISESCSKNKADCLKEKCLAKGRTLSAEDNDVRTHDKKRKTGSFLDNESSSGNEGDEGLSGDDCCIYTYKGDQFADLPNSLFIADVRGGDGNQPQQDRYRKVNARRQLEQGDNEESNPGSSPEMDYLEMDFDPGPSLEQDSEEDLDSIDRKLNNGDSELKSEEELVTCSNINLINNSCLRMETCQDSQEPQPGPSNYKSCLKFNNNMSDCNSNNFIKMKDYLGENNSCCCEEGDIRKDKSLNQGRTEEEKNVTVNNSYAFNGQPLGEKLKKETLTKEINSNSGREDENDKYLKTPFDGIMLWTEQEAISKQVTLIPSDISCGATAVINAMLVLKMSFSTEKVKEGISNRLKSESGSIPQYLVSRSFAGVAHENLIRGIHHASQGTLYARFFQMYPRRDIILSRWLAHWMKKGAVPIATMNVQRETNSEDSNMDTRHHQMIFGVNKRGIYLTDPMECLQDEELWRRLTSPSVLKIKRSEIVSRWSPGTNLRPLMFQSDDRWKKMNVLGQVVNIIRESPDPGAQVKFLTQHISIPGSSGITLVISRDSHGYEELVSAADLPLISPKKSE